MPSFAAPLSCQALLPASMTRPYALSCWWATPAEISENPKLLLFWYNTGPFSFAIAICYGASWHPSHDFLSVTSDPALCMLSTTPPFHCVFASGHYRGVVLTVMERSARPRMPRRHCPIRLVTRPRAHPLKHLWSRRMPAQLQHRSRTLTWRRTCPFSQRPQLHRPPLNQVSVCPPSACYSTALSHFREVIIELGAHSLPGRLTRKYLYVHSYLTRTSEISSIGQGYSGGLSELGQITPNLNLALT